MDPLSIGLGVGGIGLKLLGGLFGMSASDEMYQAQAGIRKQQIEMNNAKYQAMITASRRQQVEIIRNGQRARALALNSAVNQGAQLGSGLQGGLAQIEGYTNENFQKNQQAAELGETFYMGNARIGQYNMDISNAQTQMATAQGFTSLGNSLIQSGPTIGQIFKGIF